MLYGWNYFCKRHHSADLHLSFGQTQLLLHYSVHIWRRGLRVLREVEVVIKGEVIQSAAQRLHAKLG